MAASDWSEKTRTIVTVAVGVVVNAGLGFWLYTAYSNFALLEKQGAEKKKEKRRLDDIVAEKPDLEKKFAGLKVKLAKKENLLPEKGDIDGLMTSVSEQAQEAGASLLSFAPSAAPTIESGQGASYEKTIFRTRWQSDFMSWCKLLNAMEEKYKRFVAFENLTLTPPSAGMVLMGAKHEITVDMVVYRYVRQ